MIARKAPVTKLIGIVVLYAAFLVSSASVRTLPYPSVSPEIEVSMPGIVQVLMTAGDRYLAANIGAIRALVVRTDSMTDGDFAVLAKVQEEVAWLNPFHEDNYYIAAAILPWNGQLESAQRILAKAASARTFDYQPAFFRAFNQLHYKGDPEGASTILLEAAVHLPDANERLQMQNLAAIWLDKARDLDLAIRVVEVMASQTKRSDFRQYLEYRVKRLRELKRLRANADQYRGRYGKPPSSLQDLVATGMIDRIMEDPLGGRFEMRDGQVIVTRPGSRSAE